jgi:hypothetical protein
MAAEALFKTARSYVMAAMDMLSKECPPAPPKVLVGMRHWVRIGEAFHLRDMEYANWVECIRSHRDQLHALKEREAMVAALRNDPEIAPQLDKLCGHVFQSIQLTTDMVTDRLVWQVARRLDRLEFTDEAFTEAYRRFDSDLRRKECEIVIVAPLLGLGADEASIKLAKDLEIGRLNDEEIAYCLEGNLFTVPPIFHGYAGIKEAYGVRIRYRLSKRINQALTPI